MNETLLREQINQAVAVEGPSTRDDAREILDAEAILADNDANCFLAALDNLATGGPTLNKCERLLPKCGAINC